LRVPEKNVRRSKALSSRIHSGEQSIDRSLLVSWRHCYQKK
jgi:hypothetical protein